MLGALEAVRLANIVMDRNYLALAVAVYGQTYSSRFGLLLFGFFLDNIVSIH